MSLLKIIFFSGQRYRTLPFMSLDSMGKISNPINYKWSSMKNQEFNSRYAQKFNKCIKNYLDILTN